MTAPTSLPPHHHTEKTIITDTYGRTDEDYAQALDWWLENQNGNWIIQYCNELLTNDKNCKQ